MLETLVGHIETIVALAPVWGFLFIFLFMTVESSFVPFPSEIVMIPAGFLAARGELTCGIPALDLAIAVAVGLAGSLAGAFFNYVVAPKLGLPFLQKYGKYFFVKPEALERASEIFNRYGDMTTFVCRLIPVIRQLISLPAGIAKMPVGRFAFFTGLGAGIWTAVLAAVGWSLGRSSVDLSYADLITKGKEVVDRDLIWILLACAVLVAVYCLVTRLVMRRKSAGTMKDEG